MLILLRRFSCDGPECEDFADLAIVPHLAPSLPPEWRERVVVEMPGGRPRALHFASEHCDKAWTQAHSATIGLQWQGGVS